MHCFADVSGREKASYDFIDMVEPEVILSPLRNATSVVFTVCGTGQANGLCCFQLIMTRLRLINTRFSLRLLRLGVQLVIHVDLSQKCA